MKAAREWCLIAGIWFLASTQVTDYRLPWMVSAGVLFLIFAIASFLGELWD